MWNTIVQTLAGKPSSLFTLPRPSLVVLLMSALLTPDKIRILFFPTRQRLNFTGLGAGSRAQLALALELETKVFTVPEEGPFWGLLLVESTCG